MLYIYIYIYIYIYMEHLFLMFLDHILRCSTKISKFAEFWLGEAGRIICTFSGSMYDPERDWGKFYWSWNKLSVTFFGLYTDLIKWLLLFGRLHAWMSKKYILKPCFEIWNKDTTWRPDHWITFFIKRLFR
jgi:hypothetical protein